jgi:hypothetical protein
LHRLFCGSQTVQAGRYEFMIIDKEEGNDRASNEIWKDTDMVGGFD